MTPASDITLFLGRFHPLLVHLPIGLIVLLVFLELLARSPRFKHAAAATGPILALAAPAAIASAVCGLLLANSGGYDERLLSWHKWTGLAVATLTTGLAAAWWLDLKKLYRLGLFATFVLLIGASHYGGSLTHGKDYLARYAPGPLRTLLGGGTRETTAPAGGGALSERRVFAEVVKPIFDQSCVSCHGPEKAKAGLRLDTHAATLKGAQNGPVIVAGHPAQSELIKRLHLPLDHEDRMPPEGKPQPSPEDLALLLWWIEQGAPDEARLGELKLTPPVQRALEKRFGAQAGAASPRAAAGAKAPPRPLAEVLPLIGQLTDELDIALSALSPAEPWLQCNASLAGARFTDAALARLAPLAPNLLWLDLAGTGVADAGLTQVAAMTHLNRLRLERTAITDAGLAALAGLTELESLSLHSTAVTDAGLEKLKSLPRLRRVFLWQTKVTPESAQAFATALADPAQIAEWEQQIRELQDRIRGQRVTVEVGAPPSATPTPAAVAINTVCPVSGKLADRTRTTVHDGKVVAFCCDDCKATFEKDPKPHLAKLANLANPPPGNLGLARPSNARCPVSGKDVDPTKTCLHEGRLIAFCCGDCQAKFAQDPKPFLTKLEAEIAKPVATKPAKP